MKKQSFVLAVLTLVIGLISVLFLPLKLDESGIDFIKKHEAFASCPYRDQGGKWTIGYGMTYYYDGSAVSGSDDCLGKSEADFHLRRILREYEWTVHDNVDVSLTQAQYNALVSFTYNVGVNAFERSGLLKRVNNDPTDPLIVKEFYRWVYVKGRVSRGLRYRREKEIELYFSQPYLFPDREPVVSYFKPDTVLLQ